MGHAFCDALFVLYKELVAFEPVFAISVSQMDA